MGENTPNGIKPASAFYIKQTQHCTFVIVDKTALPKLQIHSSLLIQNLNETFK